MKVLTVIQARRGSSRLEGKVMLPLLHKPLLLRMYERVCRSQLCGSVIIATTKNPEDDMIADLCRQEGMECYRGHQNDLLDRHYQPAKIVSADVVVKIPSDCPLIDPAIIDQVIGFYLDHADTYDYVSNLHPASFPDGNDVEVMSFNCIDKAWKEATKDYEREHTTPYIWENPDKFRIGNVLWESGKDFSQSHRWTIDYREDYEFIRAVYQRLFPSKPHFGLQDILELLRNDPSLMTLNKEYAGAYWYEQHLDDLHHIDEYKKARKKMNKNELMFIPQTEFIRVEQELKDKEQQLPLLADMCRLNALSMVKNAGSGHLGSSLSSMDIVVSLYYKFMNLREMGLNSPDRDIYFSSKGHDVPGLYAVLHSIGILPDEKIARLRKLNGLDGHPDLGITGIESNSGSLGMGISKGRGMAEAKKLKGFGGKVFVMTGDGEFQEGQNFEALQTTLQQKTNDLVIIMDHNKVQSDKQVSEIVSLLDIGEKIKAFGWLVYRINGHDYNEIDRVLTEICENQEQAVFIVADTIKGKGVSFMEHPEAIKSNNGLYPWHAGAPDDEAFIHGFNELKDSINARLETQNSEELTLVSLGQISEAWEEDHTPLNALGEPISEAAIHRHSKVSEEYVVEAYGEALLEAGKKNEDIVVLDADLSSDCRLRKFEYAFPERFFENGIAEQDMASMAGGLARFGTLPVVNSFASFLASRANEQIYNNCTEHSKVIYVNHYGGLIPAGPGKSHQSIRDISLYGALPNITMVQPCNALETKKMFHYCVDRAKESCMFRLCIGPSPRKIELPEDYQLTEGRGTELTGGHDAVIFAYGPVMLHEALLASEILLEKDFGLRVVNMPWLNRLDVDWFRSLIAEFENIFVLEDHAPVGGLYSYLLARAHEEKLIVGKDMSVFAVEGFPACGTPAEALRYHLLDGESLADRILNKHMNQ